MSELQGPYTVAEVAVLMALSEATVTKIFENEKGVLVYELPRKRARKSYRTIRIPRHVYERVIRRLSVA